MSRIRIIITIIVVVLTTLLTGCTGKEPNEIAYVVALGIDSTDDGNYKSHEAGTDCCPPACRFYGESGDPSGRS